ERAYDMAIAASLLLGTLPFVLAMKSSKTLAIGILILVIAGLVALYAMARYRERVESLAAKVGERWPFFTKWILPQVESILDGFAVLTRPEYFALSLGLMVLSWGLALVQDYILLHSLVPQGAIWWIGFVLAAGALGAAIPSAPAGLGVFEAAAIGALSLFGVEYEKAFAFAICAHLISLIFSSLIGVIGLTLEGENISSLYQSLVNRKK
ncbi:MAG TPA: lysylphosphatidylglycerol synthase transmembrane domain-containing protein, partial [Anaerolineaceae bacterium]